MSIRARTNGYDIAIQQRSTLLNRHVTHVWPAMWNDVWWWRMMLDGVERNLIAMTCWIQQCWTLFCRGLTVQNVSKSFNRNGYDGGDYIYKKIKWKSHPLNVKYMPKHFSIMRPTHLILWCVSWENSVVIELAVRDQFFQNWSWTAPTL